MKIFVSETKKNFMLFVTASLITIMAFEIELLNIYYPARPITVLIFLVVSVMYIIITIYYYIQAKQEDKLTEGL